MKPSALIDLAFQIVHCSDTHQRKRLYASCPSEFRKLLTANINLVKSQPQFLNAKVPAKKIVEQRRGQRQYEARQKKAQLYNNGARQNHPPSRKNRPTMPREPRSLPFQPHRLSNLQKVRREILGAAK